MSPRVSFGIPVRNGERFLQRALDSIQSQTFEDFEVIVGDNASGDATEQICREYAAKDSRIRHIRSEELIGAIKNFNRVFQAASGEYFRWMPDNEWLAPEYLTRCVNALDSDPSAVLCSCPVVRIHENKECDSDPAYHRAVDEALKPLGVISSVAHERFREMLWSATGPDPVYCLVRRNALRKTGLLRNSIAADRVFGLTLSLIGPFTYVAEPLVFRTRFPFRNIRQAQVRIAPTVDGRIDFPHWKWAYETFQVARHASLPLGRRVQLMLDVVKHFATWHYQVLVADLIRAAHELLRRRSPSLANYLKSKLGRKSVYLFRVFNQELSL